MMTTNQERDTQPQIITSQVTTLMKEAYDGLYELSSAGRAAMYEDDATTPEGQALGLAIGGFVSSHYDELRVDPAVPQSPELAIAANDWLARQLRNKLRGALYREMAERTRVDLRALLDGRTIRATSLCGVGFGTADEFGRSTGPGDPTEVEGPFYDVNPITGLVEVGTLGKRNQVYLWSAFDRNTQTATIEVL